MKKLLLAAVALLFTVGASAQDLRLNVSPTMRPQPATFKSFNNLRVDANAGVTMADKAVKPMAKAVQKAAPEGTSREYFVISYDYVEGVSNLTSGMYLRSQLQNVIFGADNKVYIPVFFGGQYVSADTWLEGTMSSDGSSITVENDQPLGTYNNSELRLMIISSDGQNIAQSATFTIDPTYGFMTCENFFLVQTYSGGEQTGFLTQIVMPQLFPTDNAQIFESLSTRTLTANSVAASGASISGTVEDYSAPALGGHFVKGLFQNYPDGWLMLQYADDNMTDLAYGGQIVSDGKVVFVDDGSFLDNSQISAEIMKDAMSATCTFTYGSDGSYTQESGLYLMDLYADGKNLNLSDMYNNIILGAPTPSGISSVETDKGEPVATEYYDLSGRRVDAAAKGVTIRVDKYADGTSKAVKAIK